MPNHRSFPSDNADNQGNGGWQGSSEEICEGKLQPIKRFRRRRPWWLSPLRPEKTSDLCREVSVWHRVGPQSGRAASSLASPTWGKASAPGCESYLRQYEKSIRLPASRPTAFPDE